MIRIICKMAYFMQSAAIAAAKAETAKLRASMEEMDRQHTAEVDDLLKKLKEAARAATSGTQPRSAQAISEQPTYPDQPEDPAPYPDASPVPQASDSNSAQENAELARVVAKLREQVMQLRSENTALQEAKSVRNSSVGSFQLKLI